MVFATWLTKIRNTQRFSLALSPKFRLVFQNHFVDLFLTIPIQPPILKQYHAVTKLFVQERWNVSQYTECLHRQNNTYAGSFPLYFKKHLKMFPPRRLRKADINNLRKVIWKTTNSHLFVTFRPLTINKNNNSSKWFKAVKTRKIKALINATGNCFQLFADLIFPRKFCEGKRGQSNSENHERDHFRFWMLLILTWSQSCRETKSYIEYWEWF